MPDNAVLVDDITAQIRELILNGEIPPGMPLRQADLAERFGASRTPVRESLRRLQSSGLIEIQPNRGAVVRFPMPWELREAYEVRAELEALAARRAATRITETQIAKMREANDALFELTIAAAKKSGKQGLSDILGHANEHALHSTIHQAADNPVLQKMLNDINLSYPRNVPAMLLLENANHREENHREHTRILDALSSGDGDIAASLMRRHVVNTGDQVARYYELQLSRTEAAQR